MRLSTFDDWARGHHGLITLEASGLSRAAWYRAISAGTLVQVHPHVARIPGTAATPEQRIAAAVMAVGDGALASHRSAARLWGVIRPDDDPVDVLRVAAQPGIELDGVVLHRTGDEQDLRRFRRYSIPCTNILRTLLDLGAVDPDGVNGAVGHAIGTRLADLGAISQVLTRHERPGRPGVRALRAAIEDWSIEEKPADSVLEAIMNRLIARYRLPPVEFHPVIEGWEVDFRVLDSPVLLECDGWAHHGLNRLNFERDRRKDAELIAAGWIVQRFTYRSVMTTPGRTADRIRSAVERWAHAPTPDAA